MIDISNIKRVYFIGIGGIGMSALARYFCQRGIVVSGYDRTPTELTTQLAAEGINIHFNDDIELLDTDADLVIYTPAIPKNHQQLNWYIDHNYKMGKRSDVLQAITQAMYAITVAGTHGKTTISTLIAYLLRQTNYGCNAFLGGVAVNYNTNYWSSDNNTAVIEADEYDRSFLKLQPDMAILTAIDPDHLDIYGTKEAMEEAFIQYTKNIKPNGTLFVKYGLHRQNELKGTFTITYSLQNPAADFYAINIVPKVGGYTFDIKAPLIVYKDFYLPIGGMHNVENAVVAITVAHMLGIAIDMIRTALAGFKGVKRRFEYIVNNDKTVHIDDYAHHPQELEALILSAKHLFPKRKCVVCFQPHLFTRTRDLVDGFAASLDLADEVILLDIYPARELPIEGVTSGMIIEKMRNKAVKVLSKEGLLEYVKQTPIDLLLTAGAGDIDKLVEPIKNILINK